MQVFVSMTVALALVACESKPRRPPPAVWTERLLPASNLPLGMVQIGLRTSGPDTDAELAWVIRRQGKERSRRLDRRGGIRCGPEYASAKDKQACVADEIVYRWVESDGAVFLRWARAAGGPEETLEKIVLEPGERLILLEDTRP